MHTTQSVVDTLVDCIMLSPHPARATIKHRVDVKDGRNAQPIVEISLGDVEFTVSAATASDVSVQLSDAAMALRQRPLLDPARRLARAGTAAIAAAAQHDMGRA